MLDSSSRTQDNSLIDFDESASSAAAQGETPADDLASIFGPSSTSSSAGSTQPHQPAPNRQPLNADTLTQLFKSSAPTPGGYFPSTSPPLPQNSGVQSNFGSIMLPGTPQPNLQQQQQSLPPYFQQQQYQQITLQPSTQAVPAQAPQLGWAFGSGIGAQSSQGVTGNGSLFSTPSPAQQQQQQHPSQATVGSTTATGKDPFADLAGLF